MEMKAGTLFYWRSAHFLPFEAYTSQIKYVIHSNRKFEYIILLAPFLFRNSHINSRNRQIHRSVDVNKGHIFSCANNWKIHWILIWVKKAGVVPVILKFLIPVSASFTDVHVPEYFQSLSHSFTPFVLAGFLCLPRWVWCMPVRNFL